MKFLQVFEDMTICRLNKCNKIIGRVRALLNIANILECNVSIQEYMIFE